MEGARPAPRGVQRHPVQERRLAAAGRPARPPGLRRRLLDHRADARRDRRRLHARRPLQGAGPLAGGRHLQVRPHRHRRRLHPRGGRAGPLRRLDGRRRRTRRRLLPDEGRGDAARERTGAGTRRWRCAAPELPHRSHDLHARRHRGKQVMETVPHRAHRPDTGRHGVRGPAARRHTDRSGRTADGPRQGPRRPRRARRGHARRRPAGHRHRRHPAAAPPHGVLDAAAAARIAGYHLTALAHPDRSEPAVRGRTPLPAGGVGGPGP